MLPPTCDIAFKEWASVCRALAAGRQTIILRKGGIDGGREGFRVEHSHFWLFPTRFHQSPGELSADGAKYLAADSDGAEDGATIPLELLAQVEQVAWIESEEKLARLADMHIWSAATVHERFHYMRPGLFLLAVRCFQGDTPNSIVNRREYAGCKSGVPLGVELAIKTATPVLSDAEFQSRLALTRSAME